MSLRTRALLAALIPYTIAIAFTALFVSGIYDLHQEGIKLDITDPAAAISVFAMVVLVGSFTVAGIIFHRDFLKLKTTDQ